MNTEDKLFILRARNRLRAKEYEVGNDMTPAQRQVLSSLKDNGNRGFYKNGRLHVEDYPRGADSGAHPAASSSTTFQRQYRNRSEDRATKGRYGIMNSSLNTAPTRSIGSGGGSRGRRSVRDR